MTKLIIFTLLFIVSCWAGIVVTNTNIPSVKINFKPFPTVRSGDSIWDIITPRYTYRNGVVKPVDNVERAPSPPRVTFRDSLISAPRSFTIL